MTRLLRAVFRGLLAVAAGLAVLGVALAGDLLADWAGHTHDVVWAVGALLALPLLGAAMTLHDQWSGGRRMQRTRVDRRLGGA